MKNNLLKKSIKKVEKSIKNGTYNKKKIIKREPKLGHPEQSIKGALLDPEFSYNRMKKDKNDKIIMENAEGKFKDEEHWQVCECDLYGGDCKQEKKQAARLNSGKLNYADIPMTGLIGVARVTTYGAQKYDRFNWQKGFPMTQLVDSAMRHLIGDSSHKGALTGERYDPESRLDHFAHVAWNILAILHQLEYNEKYKQFLDLPGYEVKGEKDKDKCRRF
jgi:hypothetical protein